MPIGGRAVNYLKITMIVVVLGLAGCASSRGSHVDESKHLAQQGKLPWSSYYEQSYARYSNATFQGNGARLGRINEMILASKAYEKGEIHKDQFEYLQRRHEAAQHSDNEAAQRARNEFVQRGLSDNEQILKDMMPPKRASASEMMKAPDLKRTDATCLSKCMNEGYTSGLCQSKCSY